MIFLLQIGLVNAATVAVLVVLVLFIARASRRPQLVHTLWVLLLVKLVTPPIVPIRVAGWSPGWVLGEIAAAQPPGTATPATKSSVVAELSGPEKSRLTSVKSGNAQSGFAPGAEFKPVNSSAVNSSAVNSSAALESSTSREAAAWAAALDWRWPLLSVWAIGSLVVAATGISRIRRFARLVAATDMANSEIQRDAADLARRLGLARVPEVRVVEGAIPPVMWGAARRPIILLPADLLDRLDRTARRTILAHELAHVCRRDHWVRWLEALVVVLYWWNPVVWFIRRELNLAEELCCDAWVVWLVPQSERAYAGALVETIDFLAAANVRLPAVASGIGRSFPLKARVTAILAGPRPHRLPRLAQWAILLTAVIGLPLSAVPGGAVDTRLLSSAERSREVALVAQGAEQADRDAVQTPAKAVAADEIDLDAVGEDELVGRVVDSSGNPVAGVEVDAWSWFPGNETRTDKQGRFRLKGLGRRQFIEVLFSKPEFSPRLFLRQQAGERDWEVTMTNTTLFEGQVTANGKPVADALIRANRGPKRMEGGIINDLWTEVRSGADGHYRLYVEADKYDIQIRMPGAGVARLKETIANDQAKDLDITLAPGVAFRAKVVDSLTGKPVAGVRLWHWQHRGIEGRSNAEGAIVVEDMFPGRFAFNVEAPGFARWWSDEASSEWNRPYRENENRNWQRNFDDLDFDVGPDLGVVTVTVEQEVTIRGRVTDPDGNPVAGATVAPALTGTGNSLTGDTRFSVETGKDGRYEMHLPASGSREYNLMAHDGKYQQWRKWANGVVETIETKPGESIADLDIQLTRPASVRGRVVDGQGKPVARRQVRAAAADFRENRYYDPTTETDAEGKFELKFIRPGEQFIQAAPFWLDPAQGPPKASHHVELTAGQIEKDVELVVQPEQ